MLFAYMAARLDFPVKTGGLVQIILGSDIIERGKQLHAYVGQVACQIIATVFQHIDDE